MGERVIEVSGFDAHLSASHKQISVRHDQEVIGHFPAEDVALLVVDTPLASFTHETLLALVDGGGLVLLCGADHLPAAYVVPVAGNALQVQRMAKQIKLSQPRTKRLWQQLVKAKIRNQAAVCATPEIARKLKSLVDRVGSGDPQNVEAQAARLFWSCYLKDKTFRRDREGAPPNPLLNYGYSILRAAMARTICGAGLHPSVGLHHSNRHAAFTLADDLMEPFRPWVDEAVRKLHLQGITEVDRRVKAILLGLMAAPCGSADQRSRIDISMTRMVNSLVRHFDDSSQKLIVPVWP